MSDKYVCKFCGMEVGFKNVEDSGYVSTIPFHIHSYPKGAYCDDGKHYVSPVKESPMHIPPRPLIVCLCGSTRFYEEFQIANFTETMKGHIVLTVGFYSNANPQQWGIRKHGELVGIDKEQKRMLDELHERKIDLADEILVLNKNGYIGESTASEIEYAQITGKHVRYLEPVRA